MIPKTVLPTDLRKNLYGVVREVARRENQYLVTAENEEPVLMIARSEYNELLATVDMLRGLLAAERDIAEGRVYTTEQVLAELARRRKARAKDARAAKKKGRKGRGSRAT